MKLERIFYTDDTLTVARKLLGKILVRVSPEGVTAGRIVETEGYIGPMDAASHSYNNRRTKRNEAMYGECGRAYVYFTYGMYYCVNAVTGAVGEPEAVLIRALEPLLGIELMKTRRHTDNIMNLCSGPAKLCMAMDIDKRFCGTDLTGNELYIEDDGFVVEDIVRSKRIGIDHAGVARDYLWRYTIKDSKFVSCRRFII